VIETAEGQREIRAHTLAELRDDLLKAYPPTLQRPQAGSPAAPRVAEGWLRDKRTGCQLWYGPPGENVKVLVWEARDMSDFDVQWSGSCRDGKAHGYGLARFFKQRLYFAELDGTFEAGRARGRATAVSTRTLLDDNSWISVIAPYNPRAQRYNIYFVETQFEDTDFSGGRFSSGADFTGYKSSDKRVMTADEIARFEADRRQFRAFRATLIPR
jgi:hypothetical protein